MKPTKETKQFWLMLYAMQSLKQVISACTELFAKNPDLSDPYYSRMITFIVVIYGQPWRQNTGVGKLGKEWVPSAFIDLHERLLVQRDKVHAHKDASGIPRPWGNLNQVRILNANPNGFLPVCTNEASFTMDHVRRIQDLCKKLLGQFDSETTKYLRRFWREIKALPVGEYLLNTDPNSPGLFTRTDSRLPPHGDTELIKFDEFEEYEELKAHRTAKEGR